MPAANTRLHITKFRAAATEKSSCKDKGMCRFYSEPVHGAYEQYSRPVQVKHVMGLDKNLGLPIESLCICWLGIKGALAVECGQAQVSRLGPAERCKKVQ